MTLHVRAATLSDEQGAVDLWRCCGLVTSYNDPGADFRFAVANACSDVLVGADPDGLIRASAMVGHDGHRGWLYYVACHADVRGRGFARMLVAAGEEWLRQRGIRKVQLLVRETNTAVVSLYEHLGFETTPRIVMSKWF